MPGNEFKERLKQRMRQEHADKGKTGLGRKSILDFGRAAGKAINLWTPRFHPEENAVDVIPFVITQEWYRKLRGPSGRISGLEPGMWDYKLQVPAHRNVGPNNDVFLCLREAFSGQCFECEQMFEAYKAGDKEKARQLRPGWRCFYNTYDYDDPKKGIQLFESSYYNFEATSRLDPQRANLIDAYTLDDGGIVMFYDLEEGSTIVCKFKKKMLGKNEFAEVFDIRFEKRDPYDQSILQQVYPLDSMLVIPKPEEVQRASLGLEETEGEEIPEEVKTSDPEPSGKRIRSPIQQVSISPEPKQEEVSSSGRRMRPEKPTSVKPESIQQHSCPTGKIFGKDCNTGPECEGGGDNPCDDETFTRCSEEYGRLQKRPEPKSNLTPSPTGEETPGRRRRK